MLLPPLPPPRPVEREAVVLQRVAPVQHGEVGAVSLRRGDAAVPRGLGGQFSSSPKERALFDSRVRGR